MAHTQRKRNENNYTQQKQKPSLILGLDGRLFLVQTTFVCQDAEINEGSGNLEKARHWRSALTENFQCSCPEHFLLLSSHMGRSFEASYRLKVL